MARSDTKLASEAVKQPRIKKRTIYGTKGTIYGTTFYWKSYAMAVANTHSQG